MKNLIAKIKNLSTIKLVGLILLTIGVLFAVFQAYKFFWGSPENLKVIPKETTFVAVIDMYSIITKGKLDEDEFKQMKLFKAFNKELKSENKKTSRLFNDVMEDPLLAGINFVKPMFIYAITEAKNEKYICLSLELSSKKKFAEFLERAGKAVAKIDFDIEEEEKYSYALVENLGVAWDGSKAVFVIATDEKSKNFLEDQITTLMELKKEDQITEIDGFNKFYENKKDISLWVSTNLFEDMGGREVIEAAELFDFDLPDNYLSCFLDFGDGYISLKSQFTPNEKNQKTMDDNNIFDNTFNSKLLNYFPKQNFAVASTSINPMVIFNMLNKTPEFKEAQNEFQQETGFELKKHFENIKGNVVYSFFGVENMEYTSMGYGYDFNENNALLDQTYAISVAGYLSDEDKELLNQGKTIQAPNYPNYCINIKNILAEGGDVETALSADRQIIWYSGGWEYGKFVETTENGPVPLMGLAFDINGSKIIKQYLALDGGATTTKKDGYYELKIDGQYPAYFAFDESACFITNDEKSIKKFKTGGYSSDNLGSSDISSNVSSSNSYAFLNLNYDEWPKEFKTLIKDSQNKEEQKMFSIWTDFAKSIELKQIDKTSGEMRFNLKDTDNNSLYTIISIIDKNYKKLFQAAAEYENAEVAAEYEYEAVAEEYEYEAVAEEYEYVEVEDTAAAYEYYYGHSH